MSNIFLDFFSKNEIHLDKILNSVIDGDNLQSMKALSPFYDGKIKLIYIDPPYNTKKKFIYKDNFGSHQNWVEMMRLRLIMAKKLLMDDGFIFVSIDDNEIHYLRILMDEIFGEENFRNCIIVPRGIKNVQAQFLYSRSIAIGHEYVLFYSKRKETKIKKFEISRPEKKEGSWNNHWRGTNRPNLRYELFGITPKIGQWRWSKERSFKAIQNYQYLIQQLQNQKPNEIENDKYILQKDIDHWYSVNIPSGEKFDLLRLGKSAKPEHYIPTSNTRIGNDVWLDMNASGTHDLKKVIKNSNFDMPKPVALIKRIIYMTTKYNSNDIILDFFAGSGTTGQAVMETNSEDGGNRKFILMQTPEIISSSKVREYETISYLAYQRVSTYVYLNKLNVNTQYLIQSIPNVINSSSAGATGGLISSSNPPIIKLI
jgi:adenine-specific DNA-methyltransferase